MGPRDLVVLGRRARELARAAARDVTPPPDAAQPLAEPVAVDDPLRAMVDELSQETGSLDRRRDANRKSLPADQQRELNQLSGAQRQTLLDPKTLS